jgi:hypothetical protein
MNTNENTTEATAEITFPTEPLLAPTAYVTLEESPAITAEVIRIKSDVNSNGKPFIKLTLQMNNGRTSHDMYVTPGAAPNTFRQLKRAFGFEPSTNPDERIADEETEAAMQLIVGQKCSISTRVDDFSGRVRVAFVNRYNPHAGEKVKLASIFAAAAAQPEVAIEDVAF